MRHLVDVTKLSKEHLALAYRKAKADLYYSNDPRHLDVLAYESDLDQNLERLAMMLRHALDGGSTSCFMSKEFVGGFTLMSKKLSRDSHQSDFGKGRGGDERASTSFGSIRAEDGPDPAAHTRYSVDFRVLSQCSIDLHVLSALWLGTVGAKLEQVLNTAPLLWSMSEQDRDGLSASFGNCLRRDRNGTYNWYSVGSFRPYAHQYRHWQASGFKAAEKMLNADVPVTVVSADISRFFPSIDVGFLEDEAFLAELGEVALNTYENRLNSLFVQALKAWQARTAQGLSRMSTGHVNGRGTQVGLPIGVPASGLVANLALAGFDRAVRERLNPLFYGRYVDDIFIVLRRGSQLQTSNQIWSWMDRRLALDLSGKFEVNRVCTSVSEISYTPWGGCAGRFSFSAEKSRCYFLAGEEGKLLLASLRNSVQARASEWRALPDVPAAPKEIGSTLFDAVTSDGTHAETLSQVERLTLTRASFALRLRDYEALAKDLPAEAWSEHRKEFLRVTTEYLYALPRVVEFERFIPRLLQLAVLTGEWDALVAQIEAFMRTARGLVETGSSLGINGSYEYELSAEKTVRAWVWNFEQILRRVVASASAAPMPKSNARMLKEMTATNSGIGLSEETVQFVLEEAPTAFIGLFHADLAAAPLSAAMLPHEWRQHPVSIVEEGTGSTGSCLRLLPARFQRSAWSMVKLVARGWVFHAATSEEATAKLPVEQEIGLRESLLTRWTGLLFPTRPMHLGELSFLARALEPGEANREAAAEPELGVPASSTDGLLEQFSESALALRGYSVDGRAFGLATYRSEMGRGGYRLISVPHFRYGLDDEREKRLRVALAAVRTTREQLASAIRGEPDLGLERYRSICALINNVISGAEKAQILVLPELSLPVEWFSRLAFKLQAAGTSLIAGIEYRRVPGPPDKVRNQVWASFVHDEWGFRGSVFYLQDKQHPAHGEELNLLGENSTKLQAQSTWRTPPVIAFRGARIGILICSELTNLEYRSYLRGRIDVLIAPEWNRDLKTFSSIIETSAFDMHVFVVQANNRLHGDTRIRGPYREEWRRDVVKVSGGSHDYVLTAEIDVAALRKFQSSPGEGHGEFKALPDGFTMSQDRRVGDMKEPSSRSTT